MKEPAGRVHMFRKPKEQDEVCGCLCDDLYGLENGELKGLVLLTELCEKYGRNGVKGQNSSHVHYARLISAIAEHGCNRRGEGNHQGEESRADAEDRNERARVDLLRIDAFLICEAETSGLETKHENYLKDSDIRHELRNDTIAFRSQKPGVDRNEKEVYYAGQDSAETINDGLSGQLF